MTGRSGKGKGKKSGRAASCRQKMSQPPADRSDVFSMDALSEQLSEATSGCPDSSSRMDSRNSHRNSPSRIPLYVANGLQPHHSPLRVKSKKPSSDFHVVPSSRLVPDVIHRQQQHNRKNHMKGRATSGIIASSTLQTGSRKAPSGSGHSGAGTSRLFDAPAGSRYEDYMPLCELQKALKRGEVLEGILRINPKNYEDAYISAPGEAMDICVAGVPDRNRSLHGDKVALRIRPASRWKVLYETIKANWHNWESKFREESGDTSNFGSQVIEKTPAQPSIALQPEMQEKEVAVADVSQEKKKNKKKRLRKHSRSQPKQTEARRSPEQGDDSVVLIPLQETNRKDSVAKKGKKTRKKKSVTPTQSLKVQNLVNGAKAMPHKSSQVNGLPRDLYAKTPEELLKFSFGPFCVQKTAKVVAILEKIHSRLAGGKLSLMPGNDLWLKFHPHDSRIPRILIPTSQVDPALIQNMEHNQNSLFLATISDWPAESVMPTGVLTKFLGESGDIDAESLLLLMENKVIDTLFPEEVEAGLLETYSDWAITSDMRSERRDFTSSCVFTIDPATARDLDDALSIVLLDEVVDGHRLFEVGVHIADVSHFVAEGSALDTVASERSTSFYLVQRVIPMLPRLLCEKLCSLTPGQEKLTFSVVWKMDSQGKTYDTWFGRTVIKSCVKLAYDHAQQMIESPASDADQHNLPAISGGWSRADVKRSVLMLQEVAAILRQKRFDGGALKIDKVKFNFVLDSETGLPSGFSTGMRQDANFLVEEFMLLANMSVGERILSAFPEKAILRRHPKPDDKQLRGMKLLCEAFGIEFSTESAGSIHTAMEALKDESPANSQVVSLLLLKAMKNALYFCSGAVAADLYAHYALNVPIYTHFTSPIRRYPDILVHRLLAASLGYQKVTDLSPQVLQKMTGHCNDRKQASRLVSEGSQKLFLTLYLQANPLVEEAVVNNVLDRAFDVIALKFGIVCRVYLDKVPLAGFRFQSQGERRSLQLKWPAGDGSSSPPPQVIAISSVVKVRLSVSDEGRSKILAVLLRPDHF